MNLPFNLRFHAERASFGRRLDLYGSAENNAGGLLVLQPVTVATINEFDVVGDPFLSLKMAAGQQLFDALWAAGFRPITQVEGQGELTATKAHLEDMRQLVRSSTSAPLAGTVAKQA